MYKIENDGKALTTYKNSKALMSLSLTSGMQLMGLLFLTVNKSRCR